MKYSYDDVMDEVCTRKQYYDQFDTARKLEVGKQYVNNKGSWMQTTYTIVYVGHGVALGVETYEDIVNNPTIQGGITQVGKKMLFHSEGYLAGWKYQDPRPNYRLREV